MYEEYEKAKSKGVNIPKLIGRYQYIFSNSRGKVSMIRQLDYFHKGHNFWEIFCLKGDLFKDTERFSTKKKAIERIKKYLGVDELSELIEKN